MPAAICCATAGKLGQEKTARRRRGSLLRLLLSWTLVCVVKPWGSISIAVAALIVPFYRAIGGLGSRSNRLHFPIPAGAEHRCPIRIARSKPYRKVRNQPAQTTQAGSDAPRAKAGSYHGQRSLVLTPLLSLRPESRLRLASMIGADRRIEFFFTKNMLTLTMRVHSFLLIHTHILYLYKHLRKIRPLYFKMDKVIMDTSLSTSMSPTTKRINSCKYEHTYQI